MSMKIYFIIENFVRFTGTIEVEQLGNFHKSYFRVLVINVTLSSIPTRNVLWIIHAICNDHVWNLASGKTFHHVPKSKMFFFDEVHADLVNYFVQWIFEIFSYCTFHWVVIDYKWRKFIIRIWIEGPIISIIILAVISIRLISIYRGNILRQHNVIINCIKIMLHCRNI